MPSTKSALSLICVLLASITSYTQDSEPKRPNVVFIFVDDQGYYDLGCYGATEFETPRIDAMAAEGIRFTDYYAAAPICSPSRAGLLTGCYPTRVSVPGVLFPRRPTPSWGRSSCRCCRGCRSTNQSLAESVGNSTCGPNATCQCRPSHTLAP